MSNTTLELTTITIPIDPNFIHHLRAADAADELIDELNSIGAQPGDLEQYKEAKEEAYYFLAEGIHQWVRKNHPAIIEANHVKS